MAAAPLGRECLPAGAVGAAGEEARVDVKDLEARVAVDGERPPGLTAARGGVVFAEGVRDEHKAAWLISAAIDGHFDVSFEWSGRAQRVTLTRRVPGGSAHSDESTAAVLEQAFGHRRQLTLDGYDEHFAEAWNRLGEELAAWRKTSGLWDPTGDDRCLRAFLVGLIVAVLGVILTVGGGIAASQWSWAWTVVVATGAAAAGAGLAAVVCAWELRIRMPAGVAAWLRVESFRRFLATAGPHEADEATQRGQLGVCTAWAMALGEIDCWSEAVAASVARSRRQVLVHDPAWAPVLLNAAAATASMFGGSGDTGGGDSGSGGGDGGSEGGDGGGDGGSW